MLYAHLHSINLHRIPIFTPHHEILSTAPTITGYSPDGNLSNYVSYISEISFHTHPSEDLASYFTCYHLFGLISTSEGFERPRPGPLLLFVCAGRPSRVRGPVPRRQSNIDCWLLAPVFYHNSLARPVPDLEGLHREVHDMAEQMRIMNENNGRLMQLLAAANPQPPAAPSVPDVERSRHSNRSGNVLTTSVPDERGVGAEHQVRPYVKGIPLQNLVKLDPG
ncbi:hypothetical protein Acr_17g0008770 [Actinidia rufa]|uniref:Uncharacterized protein n=1 Tax=Actinidia rufa TaxID=165716 RepID=A0A7J0G3E0_9ERIC|nr:hypothetical protein Acr_17g0008770 [Actinidia rufa]